MRTILEDFSASSIVSTLEAVAKERCRAWTAWPEFQFHEEHQMVWTSSSVACSLFNSVMHVEVPPGQVEEWIETVMQRCGFQKVPMMWWVGPSTQPASLGVALEAKGFEPFAEMPGMAIDLSTLNEKLPVPQGLLIEQVHGLDMLKIWADLVAATSGFTDLVRESWFKLHVAMGSGPEKPFRHYIARWNGIPVSTASLVFGSGVAYLCSVMTVPKARRQGIGSAISLQALRQAREKGIRIGMLWSTEMGKGSYLKLGFQEYCKGHLYLWSGK